MKRNIQVAHVDMDHPSKITVTMSELDQSFYDPNHTFVSKLSLFMACKEQQAELATLRAENAATKEGIDALLKATGQRVTGRVYATGEPLFWGDDKGDCLTPFVAVEEAFIALRAENERLRDHMKEINSIVDECEYDKKTRKTVDRLRHIAKEALK